MVRRQQGGLAPVGLEFKLPENGFLEAPKLRKFQERIFEQILVKIFFDHMTLIGPPDLTKKGSFKKSDFCIFQFFVVLYQ